MNVKFNSLDEEKKRAIISSGFSLFSSFGYRKASMRDIAEKAGVSKALLFHYFSSKKEFYTFLVSFMEEESRRYLLSHGVANDGDFFSAMEKGLMAKMELSRLWPGMALFAVTAYYEDDEEVRDAMTIKRKPQLALDSEVLRRMYPQTPFKENLDLGMMYRDIYYMSEGYIWHESQKGELDPDKMEKDYKEFLSFWRRIYLKKEKA